MNPHTIPLVAVPAGLTLYACFRNGKWSRRGFLLAATVTFWVLANLYVDWNLTHPFNPDDGGPRMGVLFLGWLFGLVLVVLPLYWSVRGGRGVVRKLRKEPDAGNDWRMALPGIGLAMVICGWIYNVMFAGIPYQDPMPEIQARYNLHSFIAGLFYKAGGMTMLVGILAIPVMWIRDRRRSRLANG